MAIPRASEHDAVEPKANSCEAKPVSPSTKANNQTCKAKSPSLHSAPPAREGE
jgi:hypothetical protein